MQFTEFDGMILLTVIWRNGTGPEPRGEQQSRWGYERFANHRHARMSAPDREHVQQELQMAAELEAALRATYPDRSFVISHIPCYAISFYQAIGDAPTGDEPWPDTREEKEFCNNCGRRQTYQLLPTPDPIFPQAEWGVCDVCSCDMIIRSAEIRKWVPASHPQA